MSVMASMISRTLLEFAMHTDASLLRVHDQGFHHRRRRHPLVLQRDIVPTLACRTGELAPVSSLAVRICPLIEWDTTLLLSVGSGICSLRKMFVCTWVSIFYGFHRSVAHVLVGDLGCYPKERLQVPPRTRIRAMIAQHVDFEVFTTRSVMYVVGIKHRSNRSPAPRQMNHVKNTILVYVRWALTFS